MLYFLFCLGIQPRPGAVLLPAAGQSAVRGRVGNFVTKPSPVGFVGFFWVFWGFLYIFAQKREFLGFFQFQEYI